MRFNTEVGLLCNSLTLSHSVRIPTITTEVLAGPDCEFSSWSTHRRNFPSSSFCLRHHHFASVHSVCFALRDLERDWLTGNVGKLSARSAFQYYPNDSYRFAPCVLWQTWNLRIRQCVMVRPRLLLSLARVSLEGVQSQTLFINAHWPCLRSISNKNRKSNDGRTYSIAFGLSV